MSATVTAYTLNIGAVGLVGTFLGMPLDALILGAMAGAVVNGLRQAETRARGISTVLASMLLAGAFSPLAMGYLMSILDFADNGAKAEFLRPMLPVLIGAAWPWLMPILSDGLKRVSDIALERIENFLKAWGGK